MKTISIFVMLNSQAVFHLNEVPKRHRDVASDDSCINKTNQCAPYVESTVELVMQYVKLNKPYLSLY